MTNADEVANPNHDPILQSRAKFARAADLGKRIGYSLFGVAMVVFFVGLFSGFNDTWGWLMIASLLLGSVILLPSIIVGYAVSAAERADLGLPDGH